VNNILFTFFCLYFSLQAGDSAELFFQANQYFEQGNFDQAVDLYDQIKEPLAEVLMNKGIAYFNKKQYAEARLAFAQAQKKADGILYFQIDGYQRELDKKLDDVSKKNLAKYFIDILYSFPNSLYHVIIIFCFLGIISAILKRKPLKKIITLYVLFFIFSCAWMYQCRLKSQQIAVVMKEADLYAGPDLLFLKKTVIPLGKVLRVLEEKNNMMHVRTNKEQGWINVENIKLI
jgi:tetratricopeptide (TPR) repeat protein